MQVSQTYRSWLLIGTLFACGLSALVLSHRQISASLPYPGHVDESYLSNRAARMLRTGNLNPGFFNYPSLPIYLSTFGLAAGSVLAASAGDLKELDDLGSVAAPFYQQPRAMWACRMLFALLMSLTIPIAGAIALRMGGGGLSAVLASIALLLCVPYVKSGFTYLNVDIVVAFFATVAIWQMLRAMRAPTFAGQVLWPAVFCGATIASKYPSGVILIPGVLAILLCAPAERRWSWAAMFAGLACVAFVVFCPYSVLDLHTFLRDVLYEVVHYRSGHPNRTGEPGWEQLKYYFAHIESGYGLVLMGLAFAGVVASMARDARRTLVLLAYPLSLVLYMSTQRAHFARNIVPVYPMVAVFAGLGVEAVAALLTRALLRVPRLRFQQLIAVAVLLFSMASSMPLRALARAYVPRVDNRGELVEFIRANLQSATIAMPEPLAFDTRALGDGFTVERIPLDKDAQRRLRELSASGDCYFVVPRYRDSRRQKRADAYNRRIAALPLGKAVVKLRGGRTSVEGKSMGPSLALHRCTRSPEANKSARAEQAGRPR